MNIARNSGRLSLLVGASLLLVGCGGYYQITDTQSRKVYTTGLISRTYSGAVEFNDRSTGDNVTLQSSEVRMMQSEAASEAAPAKP